MNEQNGNLVIKINWILWYTHPIEPKMEITTRGINNLYILYVFNIFSPSVLASEVNQATLI